MTVNKIAKERLGVYEARAFPGSEKSVINLEKSKELNDKLNKVISIGYNQNDRLAGNLGSRCHPCALLLV